MNLIGDYPGENIYADTTTAEALRKMPAGFYPRLAGTGPNKDIKSLFDPERRFIFDFPATFNGGQHQFCENREHATLGKGFWMGDGRTGLTPGCPDGNSWCYGSEIIKVFMSTQGEETQVVSL